MRTIDTTPLGHEAMSHIDRYWRAANYLAVGQIYLMANPLMRESLTDDHMKPRLLRHWVTTHGLNLLFAHLNRVIAARTARSIRRTRRSDAGLLAHRWACITPLVPLCEGSTIDANGLEFVT